MTPVLAVSASSVLNNYWLFLITRSHKHGHEIPSSENYTGLSRKVLKFGERFGKIVERVKQPDFSEKLWNSLETLVDVDNLVRQGVFLIAKPETINWQTYKSYITQYGGATHWEATLRHITERGNRVILELNERNTAKASRTLPTQ